MHTLPKQIHGHLRSAESTARPLPDLQNDIAFLADYSSFSKNVDFAGRMVYDDNGVEVFNFGKYKGMSVAEVLKKDPGYYSWILNSDFTLNTKAALTKIRLREMSNLITK